MSPKTTEISQANDTQKQKLESALKSYPELQKLTMSDDAKIARATVLSRLEEAQKNPSKYVSWYTSGNMLQHNISEVITALKSGDNLQNKYLTSNLGDGKTELSLDGTKMSYNVFLLRLLQDASLVSRLDSRKVPSENVDKVEIEKVSRLKQFITALEVQNPDKKYKNTFYSAHRALDAGLGVNTALKVLRGDGKSIQEIGVNTVNIEKEFNIDLDAVTSNNASLANALRSIKAREEAGNLYAQELKSALSKPDTSKEKELAQELTKSLEQRKTAQIQAATDMYSRSLALFSQKDPDRITFEKNKDAYIHGLAEARAGVMIIDEFITKNGHEGLPKVAESINSMKGLKGFMSDAGADMTKEVALMVASMVLTAGLGTVFAGIATASRAAAIGVRGAEVANTAGKMTRATSAVRAAGAIPLNTLATGAKLGTSGIQWAEGVAGARGLGFVLEGAKFTTVNASLHSFFRTEGEKSGFNDFLGQLTKNTVMFGAFHGMEKFITGPVAAKLVAKFGIQDAKVAAFTVNNLTYSVGDVAVMQALHAAETGKVEFDTMSIFEALAYRVAFGMGPQGLSKLKEQFPKQTAKFEEIYGSIQNPSLWKGKVEKKNPLIVKESQTVVNEPSKNLPTGKNGDRTNIDGKEYRWSDKQNGWVRGDGKGGFEVKTSSSQKGDTSPLRIEWNGKTEGGASEVAKDSKTTSLDASKGPYRNESRLVKLQGVRNGYEKEIATKKGELGNIKDSELSPVASTEFGQAFINSLTLNYRVELLPNGNHIVKVKGPNTSEWKIATEEHGIPKGDGYARQNYEARIANEVAKLRQNPNYRAIELQREIRNLESNIGRVDSLIQRESARPDRPVGENSTRPETKKEESSIIDSFPGEKLSFRDDIADMVKMDDATFQNRFTESQYRTNISEVRPFEKEMYQGVAKVRKMSDEYIIANADTIIAEHRNFLGARHPNRGPSNLSQFEKAQIVAENAALRLRIKEIIGKKDPIIAAVAEDPAKLAQVVKERRNTPLWPLLLLLIPLIYALSKCSDATPEDKQKIADICEECKSGPKSDLKYTRKSDANQRTLTENYRQDISKRWMKSKTWMEAMKSFSTNRAAVTQNSAQTNNVATALDTVIKKGPTPENVQALQRCIGMAAEDVKTAQDGILGPITTAELVKVITSCIAPKDSPKPQKQADTSKTNNPPQTSPTNSDDVSSLPDTGIPI